MSTGFLFYILFLLPRTVSGSNQAVPVAHFYVKFVFLDFQEGEVGQNIFSSFIVLGLLFVKISSFLNSPNLAPLLVLLGPSLFFAFLPLSHSTGILYPTIPSCCGILSQMEGLTSGLECTCCAQQFYSYWWFIPICLYFAVHGDSLSFLLQLLDVMLWFCYPCF